MTMPGEAARKLNLANRPTSQVTMNINVDMPASPATTHVAMNGGTPTSELTACLPAIQFGCALHFTLIQSPQRCMRVAGPNQRARRDGLVRTFSLRCKNLGSLMSP